MQGKNYDESVERMEDRRYYEKFKHREQVNEYKKVLSCFRDFTSDYENFASSFRDFVPNHESLESDFIEFALDKSAHEELEKRFPNEKCDFKHLDKVMYGTKYLSSSYVKLRAFDIRHELVRTMNYKHFRDTCSVEMKEKLLERLCNTSFIPELYDLFLDYNGPAQSNPFACTPVRIKTLNQILSSGIRIFFPSLSESMFYKLNGRAILRRYEYLYISHHWEKNPYDFGGASMEGYCFMVALLKSVLEDEMSRRNIPPKDRPNLLLNCTRMLPEWYEEFINNDIETYQRRQINNDIETYQRRQVQESRPQSSIDTWRAAMHVCDNLAYSGQKTREEMFNELDSNDWRRGVILYSMYYNSDNRCISRVDSSFEENETEPIDIGLCRSSDRVACDYVEELYGFQLFTQRSAIQANSNIPPLNQPTLARNNETSTFQSQAGNRNFIEECKQDNSPLLNRSALARDNETSAFKIQTKEIHSKQKHRQYYNQYSEVKMNDLEAYRANKKESSCNLM
jgi:hypothetical protein